MDKRTLSASLMPYDEFTVLRDTEVLRLQRIVDEQSRRIEEMKRENQSLRAEAKPPARSRKNVPALKTKPAILRKTVATHLL